nr:hypothetical protein [Tanacetum cinerariifolium]
MLNNKCRTSFAKPEFLKKARRANPCLYDIGCYNDNLALMLAPDTDEVICLEKESRSKLSNLIRPFNYDKLNNLYDLFVPQPEKSSEQRYFSKRSRLSHINVNNGKSKESFNKQTTLLEKQMDESIPLDKQCQSSLEIFKVKTYVNTIISGVKLCKQKIANRTYIGYVDPFIKITVLFIGKKIFRYQNAVQDLDGFNYWCHKIKGQVTTSAAKVFTVILFSIHSDAWKSFQSQHQTPLRYSTHTVKRSSRNWRIRRWCYNLTPVESKFKAPHARSSR